MSKGTVERKCQKELSKGNVERKYRKKMSKANVEKKMLKKKCRTYTYVKGESLEGFVLCGQTGVAAAYGSKSGK
jgi:hypothetical protein